MATSLKAGDHRAIFADRGDHLGYAQTLEDFARHIGRRTRDRSIGGNSRKGRLVCNGNAGKALFLEIGKGVGHDCGWRGHKGKGQKGLFHTTSSLSVA